MVVVLCVETEGHLSKTRKFHVRVIGNGSGSHSKNYIFLVWLEVYFFKSVSRERNKKLSIPLQCCYFNVQNKVLNSANDNANDCTSTFQAANNSSTLFWSVLKGDGDE